MTRKRYETQADRDREALVAKRFEAHFVDRPFNMKLEKLPQGHRADFLVLRDGVPAGLMEVKTRTCNSNDYKTYHISKDKLDTLVALADEESLTPILLVQWTDAIGYVYIKNYLRHATFKEGGRWDRGDKFDVEIMAEANINNLFKFI